MAERTLTRNFAELDLTRIYLKYATLGIGIGSGSGEEAEDSGYEGDDEYNPFETPSLTSWVSSVDEDNEEGVSKSIEIMIR
jgi:hypothetical protein